ncbi:MAG TPA: hypothetical protein VH684_27240 [Xanthobacteraceae bacterium]|jgi:hypothetical protein
MLAKTGVRVFYLLGLTAGIFAIPSIGNAQEGPKPAAQGAQSAPAAKTLSTAASVTSPAKPRKEPTAGQVAARERRVKCGAEWRAAKEKGALEEGATWPKYWSACNKRLKEEGA